MIAHDPTTKNGAALAGATPSGTNQLGGCDNPDDTLPHLNLQVARLAARFAMPRPTATTVARLVYGGCA